MFPVAVLSLALTVIAVPWLRGATWIELLEAR